MTREEFISMMGYRDDSPLRNEDSLNIQTGPNGIIDMSNTGIPLIANNRYLPPYSGYHQFEPNSVVTEIPLEKYKSDPRVPKRVGARNNPDGSESTHLMRTETIDGINWVSFPTLFQNPDGSWLDMSDEENWRIPMMEAKKRGELIHFGQDKEAALRFGEGSWKPEEEHLLMREHGGSLPKAQSNIETEILNANIEADKWNKEYVQSDNYMSMLKRAGEKDKVINSRIAQAMNFDPYTHITYDINNPSLGQYYNTGYSTSSGETYPPGLMYHPSFGENMLNYNPTLMENHPAYFNPGIATSGWEGLAGHELIGHYGVDKLNRKQRKALKSLINWDALSSFAGDSDEAYDHGKDVYEMRANLGQLRYQLDKAGIYDSKKGLAVTEDGEEGDNPFTEEHLKQILEFNEDGTFKRIKPEFNNEILQFVAPQDLIWMMNNIAMDQEIGDDLPKGTMRAQDGTELTMDKYGKIDTEGMDYNTSDLYNFIKDKYTKVPTGGIQKNLLNKLQSETFRDRYAKNYFNITGEHLSEEELTNRIGQQYDFTAAGAPFHITFPYVSHTPKGYRRVHTPYISPFHTSKEAAFRNAKGMYSKNPFWGDNTPDWKIKNEEGDWVYPTIDDPNILLFHIFLIIETYR
jgi:hypothetical protein